jgi:hypothetical protein
MIDVDPVLRPLNTVELYGVADLSEVRSASIFSVQASRAIDFPCISRSFSVGLLDQNLYMYELTQPAPLDH